MAETHQEIVKVWIAPGCIVCDACETDCPEVFDVQEENCVIRPEAQSADFTKLLTPSIIVASDGCPVEVIKFETVEVEGPEPWPDQEEQAAAGAPTAGGGVAVAAVPTSPIPEGPPEPKWAGLLSDSQISHRGRAEDASIPQRAKVPVEVLAEALPANAPPDARAAVMVGSGFARPQLGLAERIRQTAGMFTGAADITRRQFNMVLAVAWGSLAAVGATCGAALQAFMVPKVSKEPPPIFRAGRINDFPEPGVYEQHKKDNGVWIIHLQSGQLVALSTTCTHLGCIPNWLSNDAKFKCPCHGSGFQMTGMNFEGPAPRPLERLRIYLEGEFVMVDKSKKFRQELGQWNSSDSSIAV